MENSDSGATGVLSGASLVAGLAAVVASSCCVLPIVFLALGLGTVAASLIPMLATLRPYLLAAAGLAVVTAWFLYFRRRAACESSRDCGNGLATRRHQIWLVLSTAIVPLALIWQPWIEPFLLSLMRRGG